MEFKLELDSPYTFSVENAHVKSVHHSDFRGHGGAFQGTWRCPVTGLVMIEPSFQNRSFKEDFKTLDDFRHTTDTWQKIKRAADEIEGAATAQTLPVPLMASVKRADQPHNLIGIVSDVAIVTVAEAAEHADILMWALESKTFSLGVDEAFVLHYNGLTDELARKNNWFAIQFDNIYLHFSQSGDVSVYRYPDRSKLATTPEFVRRFNLASPSELLNRLGYFILLPIPSRGLVVYHSLAPVNAKGTNTNAFQGITRGELIEWESRRIGGVLRLFDASMVRLAVNPFQRHVFGYQSVTFRGKLTAQGEGTFTDAIFDPGRRSIAPAYVTPLQINTGVGSLSAELRKYDDSGEWEAGTDRQARVRTTLTASVDLKRSPFLYSYNVGWPGITALRNTTPVEVDRLRSLEFSEDEYGRWEGRCEFLAWTPALVRAARRGDATFTLYAREDQFSSWEVVKTGFAKQFKLSLDGIRGNVFWRVSCHLFDMWERLREKHEAYESAFDNVLVYESMNATLASAGFPPLASVPAELLKVKMSADKGGGKWKLAPRASDNGEQIIQKLLVFLSRQYAAYTIAFDETIRQWGLVRRIRPTVSTWGFVAEGSDMNLPNNVVNYGDLDLTPSPPEANVFTAQSVTEKEDANSTRVVSQPLVNGASLTDLASMDYLGRVIGATYTIDAAATIEQLNIMARRVFPFIEHRTELAEVKDIPYYLPALQPNTLVSVYDNDLNMVYAGWVKKKITKLPDGQPGTEDKTTLHIDSVWESRMEG